MPRFIVAFAFVFLGGQASAAAPESFVADFRASIEVAHESVPPNMLKEALTVLGIARFHSSYGNCDSEPVDKASGEPIPAVMEAKLYRAPYGASTAPIVIVTLLNCDAPFWSQHSIPVFFGPKARVAGADDLCATRIRGFVDVNGATAFVGECGGNAQGFEVTKAQVVSYGDRGFSALDDFGFVRIDGCGVGGKHAAIKASLIHGVAPKTHSVVSFRRSCREKAAFLEFSKAPLEEP